MKTPLKPSEAFALDPDERLSFANGQAFPYRVAGPLRLVRLVQEGRDPVRNYWFEEEMFRRLRALATRDLLRQQREPGSPTFARPLPEMVGMYMRHCLRSDLAISKDWTPNFDTYVEMVLGPKDSLVAWIGKIANQPYYSAPNPKDPKYAEKKKIHDLAEASGVSLVTSERQYVIHFDFPANLPLRALIRPPRPF